MSRFIARRLPRQPGPAGWNRLLTEPPPPRVLDKDAKFDVAVIGAGFAGLAAARRLLQIDPSLAVAVVEAGRVGEGPAGRNSGFMIDLPHDLASNSYAGVGKIADQEQTRMNRLAIQFAAGAATEIGLAEDIFDPCGKVNAAATETGDRRNRDYAEHLSLMNEKFRILDAQEMRELTGTCHYSSGLFTPGAVVLQPAAFIRAMADDLRSRLALYEESPVRGIIRDGSMWALDVGLGTLRSERVILANNGQAESFGFFARRLMHVFTYSSMTTPFQADALDGAAKWGVTPADPMGTSVRRFPSGDGARIVVRTRFTYEPKMEVSEGAIARAGHIHDRKFRDRFPMLSGVRMEYRWAGHLCLSRNGVPAHGEVAPNVFAAVCQNGLGTVRGTLAGISAAELALGRKSEITEFHAAADAPRKLPPEPFARIGANAVLRWKELRAGRE